MAAAAFGAAVALARKALTWVLFTTNGSMRNKLHNMFGADDLGYAFAKIAIGATFGLYIFILFSLAAKPNRNPIRFYRAVKFGVDVVILAGCTYLSETLDDAPSRVVAFLCILHILPAANILMELLMTTTEIEMDRSNITRRRQGWFIDYIILNCHMMIGDDDENKTLAA
ncbi:PREDICTED: uncharacterized protein LOC105950671 [Erythranthe guttata]|uniref:uncharacterized protein LOC105950671 n=1 Tax=Erythranthe guttata TaxID=4155 RepID=UPI00064DB5B7|nr:PREDICTED: uncharacterized protein LOC105950671 [Erythranthe guttata]|eukprot:XP_012829492.1 PREDICTED: uncharacterized protein LOC105950671 [Erythranthe guttata]